MTKPVEPIGCADEGSASLKTLHLNGATTNDQLSRRLVKHFVIHQSPRAIPDSGSAHPAGSSAIASGALHGRIRFLMRFLRQHIL